MTAANDIDLEAIKAMFETGKIKRMKQLEKLSPTKIAKALGLNYGRYIRKLHNPELFVVAELKMLAKVLDAKFRIISEVVLSEVEKKD